MAFLSSWAQKLTGFTLVGANQQAVVVLAPEKPAFVWLAVVDLIRDVQKISGKTLLQPPGETGNSTADIRLQMG